MSTTTPIFEPEDTPSGRLTDAVRLRRLLANQRVRRSCSWCGGHYIAANFNPQSACSAECLVEAEIDRLVRGLPLRTSIPLRAAA